MTNYQEMALAREIRQALAKLGFTNPTEVQERVLPAGLAGRDVMVCSQTGSGKTAAFAIPMIERLLADQSARALVLAPTRELAQQIADVVRDLTVFTPRLATTVIVGGSDMRKQMRSLQRNPQIVIATPGRLNDHLRRGTIHLKSTKILVLDEGDRMLDMGFAPQLDEILKFLPKVRMSMLFTATLPPKVQQLAQRYLNQPEKIMVGETSVPVKTIQQSVVSLASGEKKDRVVEELNKRQGSVIVFTRTKRRTDVLNRELKDLGFPVELIHGGRSQAQRNRAIKNFKSGRVRILCCTDVAARGLDVPQVEHVINFDLPAMNEDYVHRIGRTARNGAKGEALTFVTPEETGIWNALAREYRLDDLSIAVPKGVRQESASSSFRPRGKRKPNQAYAFFKKRQGRKPRRERV